MSIQMILSLPWLIIYSEAAKFQLDPTLIAAIILAESKGITYIVKPRDNIKYFSSVKEHAFRLGISVDDEFEAQRSSYGLGMITGNRARELGFMGYLPELCKPEINVKYIAKYLAQLSQKYRNINDVIVSYNSGSLLFSKKDPKKLIYQSRKYLARVLRHKSRIEKIFKLEL